MKPFRNTVITSCIVFLIHSYIHAGEIFSVDKLRSYIDAKEVIYEEISIQMGQAYWNVYSDEEALDLNIPKQRYFQLFNNDTLKSLIETGYDKRDMIDDPVLKRRVEIWYSILAGAHVNFDKDVFHLQSKIENWLDPQNSDTLKPAPDELKQKVLDLMNMRNNKAQEIGYSNYAELMIEISETGFDWFNYFVALIDSMTYEPYKKFINKIIQEKENKKIEFSDVQKLIGKYYRSAQVISFEKDKMMSLLKESVENIGIDYEALPVKFLENDLPAGVGGQGIAIEVPGDFRAALTTNYTLHILWHEFGHGLQWMHNRINIPILEEYEWCWGSANPGFSEGIAETMVKFSANPSWLAKYDSENEVGNAAKRETIVSYAPVWFRFQLALIQFEIELYKDVAQDVTELQQRLLQKYLQIEDQGALPLQLNNMIFVSYPVYIHNYLIGDIISWQIHQALAEKFGKNYAFDKRVGPFLIENLWKDGALIAWQSRLKKGTGKELDVVGYFNTFGF